MKDILIVGQTPPPYGGQAIMIEEIRKFCIPFKEIRHVRMAFSEDMDSIGKFKWSKIYELFRIVFSIWSIVFKSRPSILYYPPTGGISKVPFYRDVFILLFSRFLFQKTIFHFHAGGMDELYKSLTSFERFFFKIVYSYPDVSIILTNKGQEDAKTVKSKLIKVIPYGINDFLKDSPQENDSIVTEGDSIKILFVGIVRESKGIMVLLESCKILKEKGYCFRVDIMGKIESDTFQKKIDNFIDAHQLNDVICFLGVKTGAEKYGIYKKSNIFCFPTFFECETFGVVNLEAMMFSLPIVATQWRGLSEVVREGENGMLCPIKNAEAIANALMFLINNPQKRIDMGRKGRELFEQNYTLEIFKKNIIETFKII